MGAGTIIATGIAIILLIITGYILIGGVLSTARTVIMAQKSAAEQDAERIHTQLEILNASTNNGTHQTFIEAENTGSEVVGNFGNMEVYLLQDGTPDGTPYMYMNQSGPFYWTYSICSDGLPYVNCKDMVNPGLLDPGEVVNITVLYDQMKGNATWVKLTTANGVSASRYTVFT